MTTNRVPLPGSTARAVALHSSSQTAAPDLPLSVTVVLRRRPNAPDNTAALLSGTFQPLGRTQAAEETAADPADVSAIESFAREYGLQVTDADPAKRVVKLAGTVSQFEQAFSIQMQQVSDPDGATYLTYEGPVTLPDEVAPGVIAVLGLDTHPAARARFQSAR